MGYTKGANGYYSTRVTLLDGSVKFIRAKTQNALKQKIAALHEAERQGLVSNDMKVGEWAHQWFESYQSNKRPNTQRMYKGVYNKHIFPVLGDMRLDAVKQVHILKVYNNVSDKSTSLQNQVRITCNQLFATAESNGLIARNPAHGLKNASNKAVAHVVALKVAECKTLREQLKNHEDKRFAVFALLCLDCGLRREEAAGLQWGDMTKDSLTVNRAVVYVQGKLDKSMALKTESSHRTVPLPKYLRDMIDELKIFGLFVLANEITGGPPSERELREWAKMLHPYHPHQLRHTYCTNLARAGVDLRTASRLMGHATIQMTANVYTNLAEEDISKSSKKIMKMIG